MFAELDVDGKKYRYCPISEFETARTLPFSSKILLENIVRNADEGADIELIVQNIASAAESGDVAEEVSFAPARVLFQDFTGIPVFVDYAVMREACAKLGGDPKAINPQIHCDLVIDHSVIADVAGCPESLEKNIQLEHERNSERYEFFKWAQASFDNVRIVPPGKGICHQLNIEQFASVVMTSNEGGNSDNGANSDGTDDCIDNDAPLAYFDTLVGTDSHTTTANGLGILGWGVGGIEAEAASLGQPISILAPKVIGIRLTGALSANVTAMDAALNIAAVLRERGVVGCFVECFGEGVMSLTATQRACISNMTPEYGCTCTLFPIDARTIDFLRLSGRSEDQIRLVEEYAKAQGVYYDIAQAKADMDGACERSYSEVIDFDLSEVKPSLAGPSRPHDVIELSDLPDHFKEACATHGKNGSECFEFKGIEGTYELSNGAIAIAAITSCTTATDPAMMLQAGLVARNAAKAGLAPKSWVKTILAPGSHSTEMLLESAGLLKPLEEIGFFTCGFGCMSCIGNSGPLSDQMHKASQTLELASVLSGNRNFEGRISPDVAQNYLMSPANVVLMAIAGTVDFDVDRDALGEDSAGNLIYARDLIPSADELKELYEEFVRPDIYKAAKDSVLDGDHIWEALDSKSSDIFPWDETSTYVKRAPYFDGMTKTPAQLQEIKDAVVLAKLGDFITTDHISPAGAIASDTPAAQYLSECGTAENDFNSYGSRRGNHEVMMRGTFANVKLDNALADGKIGGYTRDAISGKHTTIFDAAMHYLETETPQIVIAGKMYGSGSSRDWAAKGPALLGVKAVIAESFERIHRSNLIGMGILPLQFEGGQNADVLGLDGTEKYDIEGVTFSDGVPEVEKVHIQATKQDGTKVDFDAIVRIDTASEGDYYQNGGILQYVLRNIASA